MSFTDLRPVLYTSHLKETIEFYTNILGFNCDEFDEDLGWCSLSKDKITIMFSKPNDHIPFVQPAFTGSFYINTDNADILWEQLKTTCRVVYPLENFVYGMREFAVYDNNGYLLQFGQPLTE